jgi:hypothetical protein
LGDYSASSPAKGYNRSKGLSTIEASNPTPTPVLVVVAVVSRCTGATIWGRKDFFIDFSLNLVFGFFFPRPERRRAPYSSLGGSGFGVATLTPVSSFIINTNSHKVKLFLISFMNLFSVFFA